MRSRISCCLILTVILGCFRGSGCLTGFAQEPPPTDETVTVTLPAGISPLDNPLKGWCQYPNINASWQNASMAFHYAMWKDLEPQEGQYAFDQWESKEWNQSNVSDKHVVLRVYVDYPTKPSGLPDWLARKGVTEKPYDKHGGGTSPDYDHPEMQNAMKKFIAAFGARYNDDPRVAFIQLGMLGHWGEWHTFPRGDLFASLETQKQVIDAFHDAFPNKPLMARTADDYAGKLPWMGFHDDLFPDDTDNGEEWSFMAKIRKAGREANWQTAVIGGEMVPGEAEKWMGREFPRTMSMAEAAHFTWVGPYCPLQIKNPSKELVENCESLVRRMGYDFRLVNFRHPRSISSGQEFAVAIRGGNQGVAPFYYPWQVRFALFANDGNRDGKPIDTCDVDWDIRQWQPNEVFIEKAGIQFTEALPGTYRLAIGIIDPWQKIPLIAFANQAERIERWTVLSTLEVRTE